MTASGGNGGRRNGDGVTSAREKPRARTVSAWVLLNASLVCKVVANIWLVRVSLDYLGTEEYAVWVTLQSVVMYLALSEAGLGQTVMNWTGDAFARGERRRVNEVITTGFGVYWILIGAAWLVLTACCLLAPVDAFFFGSGRAPVAVSFALCLWVLGTLTLARLPFVTFGAALGGLRELPLRNALEIASQVGLVAVTVLVLASGGRLLALVIGVGAILLVVTAGAVTCWWFTATRGSVSRKGSGGARWSAR